MQKQGNNVIVKQLANSDKEPVMNEGKNKTNDVLLTTSYQARLGFNNTKLI